MCVRCTLSLGISMAIASFPCFQGMATLRISRHLPPLVSSYLQMYLIPPPTMLSLFSSISYNSMVSLPRSQADSMVAIKNMRS